MAHLNQIHVHRNKRGVFKVSRIRRSVLCSFSFCFKVGGVGDAAGSPLSPTWRKLSVCNGSNMYENDVEKWANRSGGDRNTYERWLVVLDCVFVLRRRTRNVDLVTG